MVKRSRSVLSVMCDKKRVGKDSSMRTTQASLLHALIVIFLEYFSWGLLTVPVINVLADTFPDNKFLMNGLILGLKGILSFLSAPLLGAMSDVWGRKRFLLVTVFFTCMPIPCLKISAWWYFTLFTLSGFFSVTFSVVLAYVADITEKQDRATACGLVSATFAASLVTSPALGAWLSVKYSDEAVVLLATIVSLLDILFIVFFVPESMPSKGVNEINQMTWQSADPLATLKLASEDKTVLKLSITVLLSYLPEAGQFSCFFVYLKLIMKFTPSDVAAFIAFVGILSVVAQTGILLLVTQSFGPKHTITISLLCQFLQLVWYGVGTEYWMMWAAGILAALSQMSYPSISAFVSLQTDKDMQGTVQGLLSGVRGLCQGIGPALFGLIFDFFKVDLTSDGDGTGHIGVGPQFPVPNIRLQPFDSKVITPNRNATLVQPTPAFDSSIIPGPPFLCGALLVFLAIFVNLSLPDALHAKKLLRRAGSASRHADTTLLIDDKD